MIAATLISLTLGGTDLSACTRETHMHAGEADHRVISQNRVAFTSWWANQGQANDLVILSCEERLGFSVRMQEVDMTATSPFDRRDTATKLLNQMEASGFLYTLDQMQSQFADRGFATKPIKMDMACACYAADPKNSE